MPTKLKPRDKIYYGWIIVLTFLISGISLAGVQFSFGAFFKSIETEFGLSRTVTSLIPAVTMLVGAAFRVLGGWALDKYGPKAVLFVMGAFTGISLLLTSRTSAIWQIFITYSLLLPIGTSANYTVTMSTIARWFDRRRGLALGISGAGPGLGMIIIAPLATYLISAYSWRTAYVIMGIIAWVTILPLSLLLKKDPYEVGALPDGIKVEPPKKNLDTLGTRPRAEVAGLTLTQSSRTRSFWLFILIWITFGSTLFFISTHIFPHVTDIGFSDTQAATVLSTIGVTVLFGRVFFGVLSDRWGKKRNLIICALIRAVSILVLIWARELWLIYITAAVYGLANGGFSPTMAALISETFGLKKIGAVIGALDIGFGLGAAMGPAIGGVIYDATQSYSLAFTISSIAMLLAIVLIIPLKREITRT